MNSALKTTLGTFGPLIALVVVFGLFALLPSMPSSFSDIYNLKTILTQTVIIGIGALGMTLVIISGGIDLSAGSQIALCSVVVARVMQSFQGDLDYLGFSSSILASLSGIGVCALVGLIMGFIITRFKIVPFIVTLGFMLVIRGGSKWLASNQMVVAPKNALLPLMDVQPEPTYLFFSLGVWILLALLLLLFIVLRYTIFGRITFAIGSNEATARLCGIAVEKYRVGIYALCGAFLGVSGVMQFANLGQGDPTAAIGMELDIIAAVVIGGGSLSGGEGSAFGTFVGALIMAVLRNGCNMLGVDNYVQEVIIGSIIVAAVALDRLKHQGT
jgi:ribose/xylose/arabinose/galactoside ABC-type transport system permease subunit